MLAGKTTLLERLLSNLAIGSFVPSAAGREPTGGSDGVRTKFAGGSMAPCAKVGRRQRRNGRWPPGGPAAKVRWLFGNCCLALIAELGRSRANHWRLTWRKKARSQTVCFLAVEWSPERRMSTMRALHSYAHERGQGCVRAALATAPNARAVSSVLIWAARRPQ